MPGSSFGERFRIATFGESHGPALGVIVDGVPAGLPLSEDDVNYELSFRRPGAPLTSSRREEDRAEIVSGVFRGKTTGAPIALLIRNADVDSTPYEELKRTPRPGHADLPYILKYGLENWDYRGGGRASGRETVARVAAGAIAKKLLMLLEVHIAGCVRSLGGLEVHEPLDFSDVARARCRPAKCCSEKFEAEFENALTKAAEGGDSLGAVVEVRVNNVPPGLGEPVFDKIKADLAKAVMSIPGVVGFEVGLGFEFARRRGSEVLDEIYHDGRRFRWRFNYCGGVLGGLTTGEPLIFRCAFKPTSSIGRPQRTVDVVTLEERVIAVRGRHDPCIALRGVAAVEAMAAVVLVDHALRSGLIPSNRLTQREAELIEERWMRYRRICAPPMAGSQ